MSVAVYVSVEVIVKLAVPHAHPRWNLNQSGLSGILDAVAVHGHKTVRPKMGLPSNARVGQIEVAPTAYGYGLAGAVDDHVEPGVEYHQPPTAIGHYREREVPV